VWGQPPRLSRRAQQGVLANHQSCSNRLELKTDHPMPTLIPHPTRIQSAGNKPKLIDEYIGRVNSQTSSASVAHMRSPAGWLEPGQTPAFDEFTIVLKGTLHIEHKSGALDVPAGQAIIARRMDPLLHSPRRRSRIHSSLPASLLHGHSPPRPILKVFVR